MRGNIVLIGFMGTGKSAVGRVLATRIRKEFFETDRMVEKKTGKSIPEIFEEGGEDRFREHEMEVVREAAEAENAVISCGGGVVLNPCNVETLREKGVIVLLTASPDSILRRIAENGKRPLFTTESLHDLMGKREPLYEEAAEYTVDTTGLTVDEITEIVVRWYLECDG